MISYRKTVVCQDCFLDGNLTPKQGCLKHLIESVCSHERNLQKNCISCFAKSFASFWIDVVEQYSTKNVYSSLQICKQSNKKCIFNCTICHHEFIVILSHIFRGSRCPFCADNQLCNQK